MSEEQSAKPDPIEEVDQAQQTEVQDAQEQAEAPATTQEADETAANTETADPATGKG